MKIISSSRYATVASTAALVVALGGTSYAAAQITSSDIKDHTIQVQDLSTKAQVSAKPVRNDNGTAMNGITKTVLQLNVPAGKYFVTAKSVVESGTNGAYAECFIVGPQGNTLDTSWWFGGAGYGYGTLANQAVLAVGGTSTIQLRCFGSASTVLDKKLTAVRVASFSNLTGPDVAKVPTHRTTMRVH